MDGDTEVQHYLLVSETPWEVSKEPMNLEIYICPDGTAIIIVASKPMCKWQEYLCDPEEARALIECELN